MDVLSVDGLDVRFVAPDWVEAIAEPAARVKLAKKKGVAFAKVWEHAPAAIEALFVKRAHQRERWVSSDARANALAARVRERLARGEAEASFDEELEAATLAFALAGTSIGGGAVEDLMQRPARALWHWVDRAGAEVAVRTFLHARRFGVSYEQREGAPNEFCLEVPGKKSSVDLHYSRDLPVLRDAVRAFGVDAIGPVLREGLDDEVLVAWLLDDRSAAARLYSDCVASKGDLRTLVVVASILDDAEGAAKLLPLMWSPGAILRLVLTHGLAVAKVAFARASAQPDTRCWAPVLACYPSLIAARLLVPMLEKKADRKLVGDALSAMPEEALVALREGLTKKSKYRDAIEALVATLSARVAAPAPSAKTSKAAALPKSAPSSASAVEVPRVLASPPWRAKKRAKPFVIEGLSAHAFAPVIDLSSVDPALIAQDVDMASRMAERTAEQLLAQMKRQVVRGDALTALGVADLELLRERGLFGKFLYEYWVRDSITPGIFGLLHAHGVAALPALVAIAVEARPLLSAELAYAGAVDVAPLAIAWLGHKATRKMAESWTKRFPEHAARGLLPTALGKLGLPRDRATHLIRTLDRAGHREIILAAAREHGEQVAAAVSDLLTSDPLEACPAKPPKLPDGVDALPAVKLRNGSVLSEDARTALVEMLAFSPMDPPYAGIADVVAACEPSSLDELAEALVRLWVAGGMVSAHEWMVRQVALIGTDVAAQFLDGRGRAWAQDGSKQRAMLVLDVLGAAGSDLALSLVGRVSRSGQRQYLKDRATEILAEIAEARGLSPDELEDRTAPDLGLDKSGALTLDFGARKFQVGFDEALRPFVRDREGTRLDSLPRAQKTDDPAKAKEAAAAWKALKTEVERVSADQIARIERMMAQERRVDAALFLSAFVLHPLVGHLAARLVCGVYDDSDALVATFRVTEDRSFATVEDAPFTLASDARVGVVHPCALSKSEVAAWSARLAEYEMLQPFAQIGREVVAIEATAIDSRYAGKKAPSALLYGLRRHGWRASADESGISRFARLVGDTAFTLGVSPALVSGDSTLHDLSLSISESAGQALSRVQLSELVHQLDGVVA